MGIKIPCHVLIYRLYNKDLFWGKNVGHQISFIAPYEIFLVKLKI